MLAVLLAAGVALTPSKGEERLRAWLESDAALARRVAELEEPAMEPLFDPDLRDSVSDAPSAGDLRRRIEEAAADRRRALAARLPGMDEPDLRSCLTLEACAQPPLSLDAPQRRDLRLAVRALLRPWLLLKKTIRVEPAAAPNELVLVTMPELGLKRVAVRVAAKPGGGYRVWFDQALTLAHVYGAERDASLR